MGPGREHQGPARAHELSRELEHSADEFAMRLTSRESIVAALRRLAIANHIDPDASSPDDALQTHPIIRKRMERIESLPEQG